MKKLPKKYMTSYSFSEMSVFEKSEILSGFPIFNGVKNENITKFAERVKQKVIRPMEVFVEQDMDEHHAFFVYQGAVSVFRATDEGEIINIDLLGAPELVGTEGLIQTELSPASAMALNEAHVLVLSQSDFRDIITSEPLIAMQFLKLLANRMTNFNKFLEHLLSHNLYERTWHMLQAIAPYFENHEITLSQEELSDLIWGTRSRVTEVLNTLEGEGKIEISHRKIKVL